MPQPATGAARHSAPATSTDVDDGGRCRRMIDIRRRFRTNVWLKNAPWTLRDKSSKRRLQQQNAQTSYERGTRGEKNSATNNEITSLLGTFVPVACTHAHIHLSLHLSCFIPKVKPHNNMRPQVILQQVPVIWSVLIPPTYARGPWTTADVSYAESHCKKCRLPPVYRRTFE